MSCTYYIPITVDGHHNSLFPLNTLPVVMKWTCRHIYCNCILNLIFPSAVFLLWILTGETHLIHLSCGSKNVWAVDIDGVVYQRIGVKAPSSHSLQAAWLPVDTESTGTSFIQVFTGPSDLMVRQILSSYIKIMQIMIHCMKSLLTVQFDTRLKCQVTSNLMFILYFYISLEDILKNQIFMVI